MVQNTPGLLLDLDVVYDIFPTEDSSLSLNDALVDFATFTFSDFLSFDSAIVTTRFSVGVLLVLESFRDSTPLEDKDFTLGLLSRDFF